ncbi:MAG: ABC transporter ATP-binding protein [Bacteroidales bacterium]|nr:ABC transporter ATP-binding protein [Bacteroidales bacterium]
MNFLCLRNVSIGYSASLVSNIDAELHSGEFVCLIGRNGSGKSTLLKTLAGLMPPLKGECKLVSCDKEIRSSIVLSHLPDLPNTTVFEFVSYGRLPHLNIFSKLRQEDIEATEQAIRQVGIETLSKKKIMQISDGERQKANIARALAQGSEFLFLDEPSAFLDYPSKHELMLLLKDLAHSHHKAILLSSHDLDLVNKYADTIWEIEGGTLNLYSNLHP